MRLLGLYRLVLCLLPPAFRKRYGEALADEAAARLQEAGGVVRTGAAAVRLGTDLAASLVREWWDVIAVGIRNGMGGGVMADLRWVLRGLRRSPGFTAAVVAMLGLGIGTSTVAVGLVDAYLLTSLPYPHADRLVVLWPSENWSDQMMDLAREGLHGVEGISGRNGTRLVLDEGGEPEEVFAALVNTSQFDVMGVQPALGRGFLPEDGMPGAEPVVVLSHQVWAERFASDRDVIGRTIALGGQGTERRTVVGVMPEDYLPAQGLDVAVWVPVVVDPTGGVYGGRYSLRAVARLAPGVTPEQLDRELKAWAPRMSEVDPSWFTPERVAQASVVSLGKWTTEDRRTPVLLALAAAILVLLVACANVTNLVVARTAGRERELSVRAALGASRLRTARTILVEVSTLGALGSAAGFGVALLLLRLLQTRFPAALPEWGLSLDLRWAGAAVLLATGAALGASLVPALQAARRDPARALAGSRGAASHRRLTRLQESLSAAQLALAAAGVAAMGLLGRSLIAVAAVDPGFEPAHALAFRLSAPPGAYPDADAVARFYREVRTALAAVTGVQAAGFSSRLPLSGGDSQTSVRPEGMDLPAGKPTPVTWSRLVTPGYLEALGVQLLQGRIPAEGDDREGALMPVVVNREAAEAFWPGQSAVGKTFVTSAGEATMTVTGVVADVREKGQTEPILPAIYAPDRGQVRSMYAVVRMRGQPDELRPRLEAAVRLVSAGTPISQVTTLRQVADSGLRSTRTLALLAAVAGLTTLLLGALGTYAVVSYGVTLRLRELGVRAALGADRGRLLRGELAAATRIVALGLSGGLCLAWLTGRALQGALFGVGALDPASFGVSLTLLAGVGYLAAYLPARRAGAVDPASVMRE